MKTLNKFQLFIQQVYCSTSELKGALHCQNNNFTKLLVFTSK